ncbi:F1F0 ATP synthase subunit gamma [Starmerella bacillaris]|uniref:ATP synthase subunit gamma n=1 Tax=Starmerella bacillaris TaxID=1247836 RepID=A0AAV5RF98_STABA|nr:F1F0 ATP synthase subunit gamma [Starmerella bacillaris]
MIARQRIATVIASTPVARVLGTPRTYATLREIETRLKSIKNIEKITNTMMIVASTRMSKAERAMQNSRVYEGAASILAKKAEAAVSADPSKTLLVVMTSDKGLCGSIHSQVARRARQYLSENSNVDLVVIGDKSKAQLQRTNAAEIKLSFSGVGKEAPTYGEAALIADEIEKLGDYDNIKLLYNKFVTGVSFEPTILDVYTAKELQAAPKVGQFEIEDENVPKDFSEFTLASQILYGLSEGHAAEISARRNAMDNASKNANDMINKYSILYNRTRQAVITNELVDIITGASSLE